MDIDEEQAALLLQKTLKGRSVQLRMLKGRARKQDLIDAMMLENPITVQDAEIVNKKVIEGQRAQLEQESLQSKEDYINSFLDRLEGETLGRMLDYLSQELTDSATVVRLYGTGGILNYNWLCPSVRHVIILVGCFTF